MNRIGLMKIISLMLYMVLSGVSATYAQKGDFRYYTQVNTIVSTGEFAPFWLTAKKNAISSVNNLNGYIRYGMIYDNKFGKKGDFYYNITADILAGLTRIQ